MTDDKYTPLERITIQTSEDLSKKFPGLSYNHAFRALDDMTYAMENAEVFSQDQIIDYVQRTGEFVSDRYEHEPSKALDIIAENSIEATRIGRRYMREWGKHPTEYTHPIEMINKGIVSGSGKKPRNPTLKTLEKHAKRLIQCPPPKRSNRKEAQANVRMNFRKRLSE